MTVRKRLKRFLYRHVPGFVGSYPYYGVSMKHPRGSWMIDAACASGIFEGDTIAVLSGLVRPGTYYFDVGANLGFMAVPILVTRPDCRVVSFEPSPNALPYLERTARESRFADRWKVLGKAVGSAVGEASFNVGPVAEFADGFDGPAPSGRRGRVIRVPVTTVDATWAELGEPVVSVLKIDVDGPEYQVLLGAQECLRACRPAVMIECSEPHLRAAGHAPDQIFEWLFAREYRLLALPGVVPVRSAGEFRVQLIRHFNFVAIPRDEAAAGPARSSAPGEDSGHAAGRVGTAAVSDSVRQFA